ncbi:ABC transporter substrate-binding protein [Chelatococcus asaccharovorans]|uniref:ABC transporter substrate-binding protein n=1 Tax=Chelatococcus asaccharovorans TaxID=28210 RepID=UPI001FE02287|nr:ABC transporter substrate-binding protein [Chelatococcus asaccharovorans]
MSHIIRTLLIACAVGAAGSALAPSQVMAQSVACPVKIGGVLSLTGSMGSVGKNIANSAQLAVQHINGGGGVKGCPVELVLRDDQGQPNVGVDAAKFLVEVERVAALTAAISSGVTIPVLTSVSVPSKIPQIACCSSAPILTTMAQEGKTGGFFFRTFPTVKNLAYPPAKIAAERGWKRIAMIYVNTDYGTSLVKDFTRATEAFGGKVVKAVGFNENQASYRAEVASALAEKPDAMFLVAFPQDGATIAREWISLGGTQNLILNNALRSPDFVKAVGGKYLAKAFGTDNASAAGPSVNVFKDAFEAEFKASAAGPGIYNIYDAVMVLGLAMNIAPDLSGTAIRDAIRKVHVAGGETVSTGPAEFKKALGLIGKGAPIKYLGATGPVEFDANGDVSGPALAWRVDGTDLVIDRSFSTEDMQKLFKEIDG